MADLFYRFYLFKFIVQYEMDCHVYDDVDTYYVSYTNYAVKHGVQQYI